MMWMNFLFHWNQWKILKHTFALPSNTTESVYDTLPFSVKSILAVCTLPQSREEGLSNQECNTLTYISGYIIKKIRHKICPSCSDKIVGILDSSNPNHHFIAEKSYTNLTCPSSMFLGVMQKLELQYRLIINSVAFEESVKTQCWVRESSRTDNMQLFSLPPWQTCSSPLHKYSSSPFN